VIPIATWPDHERRLAAGDRHDLIRQLSDRRLDAAGEVVDVAWIAAERACQQPPDDVADVDEVAAVETAAFEQQRLQRQRLVDEGRDHVPPYGGRRAAPLPSAEDLTGTVYVLKPRPHGRKRVAVEVVDRVKLTNDLRDRIRAVHLQRQRRVFR